MIAKVIYKISRYLLFRIRVRGRTNIPSGFRRVPVKGTDGRDPMIVVSNHAGTFGPISLITSFPSKIYPWVNHEVTDLRTVARRVQAEFLEAELHLKPPLSSYLGRVIGRVCVALMKGIHAIPVYDRSKRIKSTVEQTLRLLEQGKNILVFPENSLKPINDALCEFCTGFLHVAKLYFEKTKRAVSFLPVAVNRKVKSILIGKPIRFDATVPFPEEKTRLKELLELTVYSLYRTLEDGEELSHASGGQ